MILTSLNTEKTKIENLIYNGLNEIFKNKKIHKNNIEYYIKELDDYMNVLRVRNIIYDYDISVDFGIILYGKIVYFIGPLNRYEIEFKG
jgi:hypothetical protein